MTDNSKTPLHGVRVLDLSRILAGPYATMQLGDLGAEIIKIEAPHTGDDTRQMKPPEAGGESHFFLALNRNKKSVTLDLKCAAGLDVLHRLAEISDVLVENFRPGVMKRLGLDYDSLKARHPHLIYCSISSYGQRGMMSDRPGFDPVIQAEMGLMALTGEPDGEPMRHPLPITDLFTGLYTTSAILAAIIVKKETGRGQHVQLSLMESALGALTNFGQYYLTSGEEPPRMGNNHPVAVPVGLFHAQDGHFYLACGTNRHYTVLCENVLGMAEMAQDPRFATGPDRVRHKQELFDLLNREFAKDTLERWLDKMRSAGIPAGKVRRLSEALESPEVQETGILVHVPHPTAGDLRLIASPIRFSESAVAPPVAPPLLGQHTEEVLDELLSLDSEAVEALRRAGVMG